MWKLPEEGNTIAAMSFHHVTHENGKLETLSQIIETGRLENWFLHVRNQRGPRAKTIRSVVPCVTETMQRHDVRQVATQKEAFVHGGLFGPGVSFGPVRFVW